MQKQLDVNYTFIYLTNNEGNPGAAKTLLRTLKDKMKFIKKTTNDSERYLGYLNKLLGK